MPDQALKQNEVATLPHPPSDSHDGKENRKWVWVLVVVLIIGAGGYYYMRQSKQRSSTTQADAAPRLVPVSIEAARKGDIGVYISALGAVTPVYTDTITSRVQGEIVNVYYKEGQLVHKGDPLLDIDPRPYQAQLTQAEGQLAHDQALLNEAKIDLSRYQSAYTQNAIAKQQVDDQEQAVLQYEGTVKNDQGVVENAKVNLVYCHITSPIEGRVGLRLVDPGNIVQANSTTSLVVVTQLQPITVVFSVAEDYLPQIQEQMRKGRRMDVDAFDRDQTKKLASGTLLTLDNQIDPTTGTIKLKAIFPNSNGELFANQFVNARLLVDTTQGAILIPASAIQRNAQGAFVYVIKPDNTATIRTVTVGTTDGDTVAVQGIQPGETVATKGFEKLQDGARVAVQNQQNQQNGSQPGADATGDSGSGHGKKKGSGGKQTP